MNEPRFQVRFAAYEGEVAPLEMSGVEEMNRPYRFKVHVAVPEAEVDAFRSASFEERATLTLATQAGDRLFHGVVDVVAVVSSLAGRRVKVALSIVPRFDWLQLKSQSRIFQNLSTREIVETICRENRVLVRFELDKDLGPRVYACQYGESDLHFITRLLAEDGLFYRFDHALDANGEVLVVADSARSYAPIQGDPALVLAPPDAGSGMHLEEHHATAFVCRAQVRTRSALRRAHDMRRPSLAIADARVSDHMPDTAGPAALHKELLRSALVQDDHLGEREAQGGLRAGADRQLDALRARALVAKGRSVCRRLAVGATFRVDGAPSDLGRLEFVATRVRHRVHSEADAASRGSYENRFEAAPRDTPMRPPAARARTRATMETAIVVGPAGQELYTDELGRVRVQFHWDLDGSHDERSSCWLRVSQAWAGAGFGAQFLPRVGMEVIVSFVGGDPDRPVVTGTLHNGAAAPPLRFPQEAHTSGIRTRSTPGGSSGHELLFGDEAGGEYVALRSHRTLSLTAEASGELSASGDLRIVAGGTRTEETSGDAHCRIAGGASTAVGGASTTEVAGAASSTVGASRDAKVGVDDRLKVEGAQSIEVKGSRVVTIGSKTKPTHDVLMVSGALQMSSSSDLVLSSGKGIRLQCGKSRFMLLPDKIVLESARIEVIAEEKISLVQGDDADATLTLAGEADLKATSVKLATRDGAKVELDGNATVRGEAIRMLGTQPPALARGDGTTERAIGRVLVRKDWFPADVTAVTVTIAVGDGTTVEKSCAPGGTVEVEGPKGSAFRVVAMRVGDQAIDFRHA